MEQLSPEAKARIFAAADALYAERNRESFPTVDAVRRQARVNMNDASLGMKEWRKAQLAGLAEAPIVIPDVIQQSGLQLLGAIWQQAQDIATEGLRAAQHVWENERQELETIQFQVSSAFEETEKELARVANELSATITELSEVRALNATLNESLRQSSDLNQSLKDRGADLLRRAEVAEGRCEEINRLTEELRGSLDRAHSEIGQKNHELTLAAKAAAEATVREASIRQEAADRETKMSDEISRLMAMLAAKDQEIKDLTAMNADVENALNAQLETSRSLQTELGRNQGELGAAKARLDEQKTEIDHLQTELGRNQGELGAAKARLDEQKTEIDHLQTELDKAKSLLNKKGKTAE